MIEKIKAFHIHPSTHLAHAEYIVRDLSKMLAFYGDLMGMQVIDKDDGIARLSATGGMPVLLALVENENAHPMPSMSHMVGQYHIAFRFPGRTQLATTLLRIAAAGYPLQGAADHLFSEAVYLADPEGNGIELYRDRPREEWPRMGEALRSGNLPLDLRKLLDEADQNGAQQAKVDPGMDIGHIHLQVSNLASADSFYHQLLGLDVMMSMPTALFFAAGGYHHHVGANTWHSLNAPRRDSNATGLASFAFDVPDEDGWLAVFNRVEEKEPRAVERDGRPGILLEDSDGLQIELLTSATDKVLSMLQELRKLRADS